MADQTDDKQLKALAEMRKLDVNYEEHAHQKFDLRLTPEKFKIFPVLDENVTYKKERYDTRADLQPDSTLNLPDYSGPFKYDLRLTDFSNAALIKLIGANYDYYKLCVEAWASEVAKRYGHDEMVKIQRDAWNNNVFPVLSRITKEFGAFEMTPEEKPDLESGAAITFTPFRREDSRYSKLDKEQLAKLVLGSHEFFLVVIEGWSTQVIMRRGLDELFSIQWDLWSDKVLPETRAIKERWMKLSGGNTHPVAAFMKDMQIDGTSMAGKAFDMVFDMPKPDVGIVTFNKCCAVDQWEALGRPDVLKVNCHAVCPASIIETAKMYDPNMRADILTIPPRKSKDDVCCKWKLSMRDKSDPEYVPVAK